MEFLKAYVVETRRPQREDPSRGAFFGDNSDPYAMRHAPDKHAPDRILQNQVYSMRNPPLSAGISPCVRKERQEKDTGFNLMSASFKHEVDHKTDDEFPA